MKNKFKNKSKAKFINKIKPKFINKFENLEDENRKFEYQLKIMEKL